MIVGVDLGTRRVALACPAKGWVFSTHLQGAAARRDYLNEVDAGRALGQQARTAVLTSLAPLGLEFWFERPMVMRNTKTAIGQGLSGGALLSSLPGSLHECSNTQWKKELTGDGRINPDGYRAWLSEHHPPLAALCGQDEDLFAATCIALWAELASGECL